MLEITTPALKKMQETLNGSLIRVCIDVGGCMGFSYKLLTCTEVNADDLLIENVVVVDALALKFLQGAIIDIKESIAGYKYVVKNIAATNSCGCGTSFTPAR